MSENLTGGNESSWMFKYLPFRGRKITSTLNETFKVRTNTSRVAINICRFYKNKEKKILNVNQTFFLMEAQVLVLI